MDVFITGIFLEQIYKEISVSNFETIAFVFFIVKPLFSEQEKKNVVQISVVPVVKDEINSFSFQ